MYLKCYIEGLKNQSKAREANSADFEPYIDFDWDRANFLLSSWCAFVFWICDGNRGDNTDIFVTVKQPLDRVKAFCASHPNPPVRRLEVLKF